MMWKLSRSVACFTGLACTLALTSSASAQWAGVDFTDETSTRLAITTVNQNTDAEEKDIAWGDLDGDGWNDAIIARKTPFTNATPGRRKAILVMNLNGVLTDRTSQFAPGFLIPWNASQPTIGQTDAREVFIRDMDNDGWLDVVFANTSGDLPRYYSNKGKDSQGNWLGLANESNRFGPISVPLNLLKSCSAAVGDVDNDGDLDIYFGNYLGGDEFLYMNNGNGTFTDETASRLGDFANAGFGTGHELHDIDGDGDLDAFKCTTLYAEAPFNTGVYILWNNGAGKFNAIPFAEIPNTASPYMFRMADFNNDNKLDVYVVQDGQDQVKLATNISQHNVTWAAGKNVISNRTAGFGGNVWMNDFDKDGLLDVGVAPVDVDIPNCGGGQMALLRNMGNGQLTDPYPSKRPWHVDNHDMAFFDINNDGCADMLTGNCVGYKVFMFKDCPQPPSCYADCDLSGSLSIDDFICFQTLFALADPTADCDASGNLSIDDFICFQTFFALGC
jgi:FG-GAP-like repeat